VQLLEAPDGYCYISDGAESLQSEWCAHLLSRRGADGKLNISALDLSLMNAKTAEAQSQSFTDSLKLTAELLRDVGVTEEISPLIVDFKPESSMNDRASTARKAARGVRGVAEGEDDPTCAHHAVSNIFGDGHKAIDKVLRELMNITEEQAAGDAHKVKALRVSTGWFSSPAGALIYQIAKYVALFSSKGYAVGAKFRKWIAAELEGDPDDESEGKLRGFVEDMLAICGGRDYVFYLDAAVADRFAQEGSLRTFLQEEADLGGEAGGKLRSAILTGMGSEYTMAAIRSLALICDSSLFTLLRCIGSDDHILDVLPRMWPATLAFFEAAAAAPETIIEGSLELKLDVRDAKVTPRSRRAATDMQRIRRLAIGDTLVARMLAAAFTAMAAATRNHASEWLPGGDFALDKVTPEMRVRLAGMPITSISAERMFALGRFHDQRAGASRDDTRSGVILGGHDDTAAWMRERENGEAEWRLLRKKAREGLKETMAAKRLKVGASERAARDEKLSAKRAARAARAAEKARLEALVLATHYSELVSMGEDALKDQLRKHKLLGKKGFNVSQPNRTARVLALQALMLEADAAANDLEEGDSGIEGRGIKRKVRGQGKAPKKKQKGAPKVQEYMGYEWTDDDPFVLEAIVGSLVADGKTEYANQGKAHKGTMLYRVIWENYPPDMVWYEPKQNVLENEGGDALLAAYEAAAAEEAEAEAAEAAAEAELDELEEQEAMPAI
jgi:hypothetical protein